MNAHHATGASANHKSIAYPLADGYNRLRCAVVHGYGGLGFSANLLVAGDVPLRDRGLHDLGDVILFYMLQDWCRKMMR